MKIGTIVLGSAFFLAACGGYTEKQGEAAEKMCECMEQSDIEDYDIKYFECDLALKTEFAPETFEEGTWPDALDDKCPDLNKK